MYLMESNNKVSSNKKTSRKDSAEANENSLTAQMRQGSSTTPSLLQFYSLDNEENNESNQTGIPAQMKKEHEEKSGLSFDDVRVHYNSDKPAKLNALAYTQGNQVHLGKGQEKHLRHELGHVVQQKLGLVRPTRSVNGVSVNDDESLEHSADRIAYNQSKKEPRAFEGASNSNNDEIYQMFGLRIGGRQVAFDLEAKAAGTTFAVNKTKPETLEGLSNLGAETLYILGHGVPAMGIEPPKVDVYNPKEFVDLLLSIGYVPKNHSGNIDFKSCTAGWRRTEEGSFIEQVYNALETQGFNGRIYGVSGFGITLENKEIQADNRIAEPDIYGLVRYQDFGVFRQVRAWEAFLGGIVYNRICDIKEGVESYNDIMNIVDKKEKKTQIYKMHIDLENNMLEEFARQSKEFFSIGDFTMFKPIYELIASSTVEIIELMNNWRRGGFIPNKALSINEYIATALDDIKGKRKDLIPHYSDKTKYLQPIGEKSNTPAIKEEVITAGRQV